MALLNFMLAVLLASLAGAAYIDGATQARIRTAIGLCDTETQAATSGAYSHFKIETVVDTLTQVRALADSTRLWQKRTTALAVLAAIDQRIAGEISEAQSGRWRFYTLATTARLMQELKSSLEQYEAAAAGP